MHTDVSHSGPAKMYQEHRPETIYHFKSPSLPYLTCTVNLRVEHHNQDKPSSKSKPTCNVVWPVQTLNLQHSHTFWYNVNISYLVLQDSLAWPDLVSSSDLIWRVYRFQYISPHAILKAIRTGVGFWSGTETRPDPTFLPSFLAMWGLLNTQTYYHCLPYIRLMHLSRAHKNGRLE